MHRPPKWLYALLERCCPSDRLDVLGDFEEWYVELVNENGSFKANCIWLLHSMTMLRLKMVSRTQQKNSLQMTGLSFKLAKRNLLKSKLYTTINVLGLAVGLAVCTLIAIFIQDELSYDQHFADHERIYRIAGSYDQGGDMRTNSTLTPFLLQRVMQNNLDTSVVYSRMDFTQLHLRVGDKRFWEDYSAAVDSNFFEVFETKFLAGDPATALDDPGGVVIDLSTTARLFEDGEAMGKSLEILGKSYLVTGVIEDLPDNTHFEAHIFIPISSIVDLYPYWVTNTFGGVSHRTYFKVPEEFNIDQFEASLNDMIEAYTEEDDAPEYFFQPASDIHLHSDLIAEIEPNGNINTLYIFMVTAIVVLLMACINFINLCIAGSLERLKEVGVKKVLGATRRSQVLQFQLESLLVGFMAACLSLLLVELALPLFNQITNKTLVIGWQYDLLILAFSISLIVFISLISGSFPALFLLKIPSSRALKGQILNNMKSRINPRNVMVGIQFFLAAILISCTLVILEQIRFMQNKDLGISTDQVVMVPLQSTNDTFQTLKEELKKQPSIVDVTASTTSLANGLGGWRQYRTTTMEEQVNIPTVVVSHDYFETIGAQIVAGRSFDRTYSSDGEEAYVINEAAAQFLNLENPVGEKLEGTAYTGLEWSLKNARIIGVVKDFHFSSLHSRIRPVIFSLSSEATMPLNWMLVKITPDGMQETVTKIEEQWININPDAPFRYQYANEVLQEHYEQETRFLKVFSVFAGLSIFIGCLGLFGLTAFIMRKRTKEIGIRKVLGANQMGLVRVLSSDFIKLVTLACLPGIPVTVWMMTRWLSNFEYRITLGWEIFGLTIFGSLMAAMLSILYHSLRISRTNPIASIKSE